MRFSSFILFITLLAYGNGESTQLLQIPRVMRNALGSRNYAIQVPDGHPVEEPNSGVETDSDAAIERVHRKQAKQQINAALHHKLHPASASKSKSGKKSVKSHKLTTDSDDSAQQNKLRRAPSEKKPQGNEDKATTKKGKGTHHHHHHKTRRSTTTTEAAE